MDFTLTENAYDKKTKIFVKFCAQLISEYNIQRKRTNNSAKFCLWL